MHTNTELMIMFIDILAVFAERTVAPRFAACESTEREKERGKKVLLFREERKKEGREREEREERSFPFLLHAFTVNKLLSTEQ